MSSIYLDEFNLSPPEWLSFSSKSSPYVYQYDEPGMPFQRLAHKLHCDSLPSAVECLRKSDYKVRYLSLSLLNLHAYLVGTTSG